MASSGSDWFSSAAAPLVALIHQVGNWLLIALLIGAAAGAAYYFYRHRSKTANIQKRA